LAVKKIGSFEGLKRSGVWAARRPASHGAEIEVYMSTWLTDFERNPGGFLL